MQAEIVMIGTELLLGQIVDTNAAFLGQTLAENGINLFQKSTVGDNYDRIVRILNQALDRADVVLVSGGLGPTEDDITRECIADVTGRALEFREDLYETLAARFARVSRPLTENNKKQAYAPRGATSIPNPNGTAPGLIVECDRGIIIAMPGVPFELEAMLTDTVLPFLKERFGLAGVVHYRVLQVCGVGESRVDAAIGDLINAHDNPKIGLLASPDAVRIRISARAQTRAQADALIDEVDSRIRERLPGLIMGVDEDTIESAVDGLLRQRGWRMALGETITGGLMAQRFVAIGASSFAGGQVATCGAANGEDLEARAGAWADELKRDHAADAALAIVADPSERRVAAVFRSPENGGSWTARYSQLDARNQLRTAVVVLEHVRRHLTGTSDPETDVRT